MTPQVFIAVPSYGGQPATEMVVSLMRAVEEAAAMRLPALVRMRPGDSLLTRARNVLVQQFLDSGANMLVFWDDDVACGPGDFERLLAAEAPIVAGGYRFRADPERYPIRPLDSGWRYEGDLVEVAAVPAGFLCITRAAVERMIAERPGAWFHDGEVGRAPLLFENEVRGHELWGEDFVFCRRAREAGLKILVEPRIRLTHVGRKAFAGDFQAWFGRQLAREATPDRIEAAKGRLEAAFAAASAAA